MVTLSLSGENRRSAVRMTSSSVTASIPLIFCSAVSTSPWVRSSMHMAYRRPSVLSEARAMPPFMMFFVLPSSPSASPSLLNLRIVLAVSSRERTTLPPVQDMKAATYPASE